MVGAALAVGLIPIPVRLKSAIGIAGLSLIAAAMLCISREDPFPSWRAAVPAFGAAAVIAAGPGTLAGQILSARPLVYVGRISYSLYLWHWPIFVFLRHYRAEVQLSSVVASGGIALAFALSTVTYQFIERPARRRSISFASILLICGAAASAIMLAVGLAIATGGLPQRLPRRIVAIAAQRNAYAPLAQACTDIGFERALEACHVGPPGNPHFLLWGDSHAAAVSEAVAAGLDQSGIVISMGACAPNRGWLNPELKGRDPATCRDLNARTGAFVERESEISTVVLSAYWASHERVGGANFWRAVQMLADELRKSGKRVVVIAGIPDPGVDVPWASAIRERFGRIPVTVSCPKATVPLHRVIIVDLSKGFCDGAPAWRLFTDGNHVSRFAGLSIITPKVAALKQSRPRLEERQRPLPSKANIWASARTGIKPVLRREPKHIRGQ
jgi:hypothetical protein